MSFLISHFSDYIKAMEKSVTDPELLPAAFFGGVNATMGMVCLGERSFRALAFGATYTVVHIGLRVLTKDCAIRKASTIGSYATESLASSFAAWKVMGEGVSFVRAVVAGAGIFPASFTTIYATVAGLALTQID